jgi:hypothetical protein
MASKIRQICRVFKWSKTKWLPAPFENQAKSTKNSPYFEWFLGLSVYPDYFVLYSGHGAH